ncbi:MAG: zinc ribbon domain-containing protein [Methanobrevibacter sp.]|uniref:zinc ribbon domain-containing protein n=1 Tax=Methanobrevibacter sp. TaxID=66852 RepID=UPI0025D596F5|nr:zinc ribbon domain-containing protein [Methanobrevibacter sp.]MBQ6100222.1 zinc ribbon domain-containing protein [Methanobrevibacter sp.]
MKCPSCQSENSDSAKFCKKCGTPLDKKTISHESMINSMSEEKSKDNTTKIIIIALVIVAIVLAGAFVYLYAFNGSSSDANSANAQQNTSQVDNNPEKTATQTQAAPKTSSSMSILGGSFSTGSAESDKTYAQIYVGTSHAGESVIVQIYYSRDGNLLNHGNMVPASVHSDGYLYISSADAYHYYPDYATINLYDSNSNLMDTQSVSLSPTSGTQTF